MAKRNNHEYPPLSLLKETTSAFPAAWADMERFHAANGAGGLPSWPTWCYAPMAAACAAASRAYPDTYSGRADAIRAAQVISALAPWRMAKEVFVMDADMQGLLFEQADDLKLDPEVLMHLPYPCFYVQFAPGTEFRGTPYHGFFVHLEYDANTQERELRLLFLMSDGQTAGVPIHIDAGTIEESIQRTLDEAYANVPDGHYELRRALFTEAKAQSEIAQTYSRVLQLVLYLCAQNAEIAPNSEQAVYTRRNATIKDRYAEIQKWDVGVRIGNAVRAHREKIALSTGTGETHSSPRPHMRRGHWHSFWTGPKSTPEERKLILKWVAPTFVCATEDDMPVTLHHVFGEKGKSNP